MHVRTYITYDSKAYHGAPFFEGYKFCKWSKKEVRGNLHVNLHEMEFSVKQISWKSQKSTKFVKFTAFEKRVPYNMIVKNRTLNR